MTFGSLLLFAPLAGLFMVTKAHSQGAPSDGALPPEFMKEIDANPAPAEKPVDKPATPPPASKPATPPPAAATPPPAASAPAAKAPSAPPPTEAASPAPPPPPTETAPPAALSSTALAPEEYVYDPTGRRDPFKPFRAIRTNDGPASKAENKEPDLEPLQNFDLEQLNVIGILWDVRQPKALVMDSTGKVHTLVKNTKLGRNNGYVAAIREGEVVVVETVDEEGGNRSKRTRTLEFRKKD